MLSYVLLSVPSPPWQRLEPPFSERVDLTSDSLKCECHPLRLIVLRLQAQGAETDGTENMTACHAHVFGATSTSE